MRTIKCPKCGKEYLVGEIYIPDAFVGAPKYVERDSRGQIINYLGTDMDTTEFFTCEDCDTHFKVEASVTFNVEELTDEQFQEAVRPKYTKKELF